MPPRVAYWLSSFEPDMEAVASEAALLRSRFRSSAAWGLSHRHWALISRRRGCCLHPRLHLLFRAATRLLEPAFDLNHIFGCLGDWFYLEGRGRRPTILTLATSSAPTEQALLDRVDCFVAEEPASRDVLRRLGIERRRLRMIFPPVDLERFFPAPSPDGPFTVLFASSPDDEQWLAGRGVLLLLEAAALRPQVRFRLLWRPWGNSLEAVRRILDERRLDNVEIVVGRQTSIERQYNAAHVTVAPFLDATCCKPAPNSLLESLACGRPVLTTKVVGLADLIDGQFAGRSSSDDPRDVAEKLDCLRADWATYSANARSFAEQNLGAERFLASYQSLYDDLLARKRVGGKRPDAPDQPANVTSRYEVPEFARSSMPER